ncbi:MAG: hypothetical protein IKV13_02795 [Akkermansia sp.]|nr:hypothetical protein [Akkermansia sp.]
MNATLAVMLFLLGLFGLVLFLFTSLRQHSCATEGTLAGALFMLIPVVSADLLWLRWVLGIACFVLWLLLAAYGMNEGNVKKHRHGKRRSR